MTIPPTERPISCVRSHNTGRKSGSYTELADVVCRALALKGCCHHPRHIVAVMDADMQHDEAILPQMLQLLKEKRLDIVVGSRYVEGGSVQGLGQEASADQQDRWPISENSDES